MAQANSKPPSAASRAVQANSICCPAAGPQHTVARLDTRKLALELEHEGIDAVIRSEHVGAEPDDDGLQRFGPRETEHFDELFYRSRARERTRGTARPDRRQA